MLNAGQGKRISIYQSYFVFVPLFSKPKANYIIGLLWDLKSPKVAQSRLKSPKIALSRLKSP